MNMSEGITPSTHHAAGLVAGGGGNASRWESSAPIRYPDPDIVVLDPRFQAMVLGNAAIERIATGFRFTEDGPLAQRLRKAGLRPIATTNSSRLSVVVLLIVA